jgi:hypothetical protein
VKESSVIVAPFASFYHLYVSTEAQIKYHAFLSQRHLNDHL